MPYPLAKPDDAVQLKTFDPATFYPALSASEKLKLRDDSVTTFPSKSISEPKIPKDFDPAVFYPALAAMDKAKIASREDSMLTDSIYPSSSISQTGVPRSERSMVLPS